jgi:hypothetical protein
MEDFKTQSLADTLMKNGLASSNVDAVSMARNILGTEQKVASGFDRFNFKEKPKKMTYQEEIDDLIKKTSPEYKNYHIPIKGYKRDPPVQEAPKAQLVKEEAKYSYELDEVEPAPIVKVEDHKEVYTDVLSDARPLHQLVNDDQGDVVALNAPMPAQVVAPVIEKEEFIINVDASRKESDHVQSPVVESQPTAQPEQLFKEIKEDKSKPHEVKSPIEKVDLMNYFKCA